MGRMDARLTSEKAALVQWLGKKGHTTWSTCVHMHASLYACMCLGFVCACMQVCMQAWMQACMQTDIAKCVCAYAFAHTVTRAYTYRHVCMQTCVHADTHA